MGALLGLAVDVRLLFAAALPAFAWQAARRPSGNRSSLAAVSALACGLGIAIAPSLLFLALDPGRFVFNNLGVQGVRSSEGLIGNLHQKVHVAEQLLGIGTPGGAQPQFVLLLAAATAAAAAALTARRLPLSLAIALLLGVASILPTPSHTQYFCTTVPFLAVGTAEFFVGLRRGVIPVIAVVAFYAVIGLTEAAHTVRLYPDEVPRR